MKLTKTGSWIWREGETSYAKFSKFNKEEKETYLNFLLNIGIENLSTNDWYILNHYAPEKLSSTDKAKKFLEL
jgi:hypothetical protein